MALTPLKVGLMAVYIEGLRRGIDGGGE
jgi:hypothetical protein